MEINANYLVVSIIACLSPFSLLQASLRWGRMARFLHLQLARLPLVDGRGATNNQTDSPPPPPAYKVFYVYIYILFLLNRMNKELFEGKCCSLLNLVHYFVE